MGSTGVDKPRNTSQRINDNTIDITKQIIDDTKVYNSTSPVFGLSGEQSSAEGSASGNYLSKSGDVRLGPMGNEFTILEIIDNTINVSVTTSNFVPFLILNPEGGAADDLSLIIPGERVFLNQELYLQNPNDLVNITLKNLEGIGGNIITPDGNDLILSFGEIVKLYYSQLLSAWVVVWISSGGTGGVTGDVSVATLLLPSSQLAGVVDFEFTSESPVGTGITEEGDGIFKLSGGIFQLNSSVLIVGTNDSLRAQWQSSSDLAFTTPVNIGSASLSITFDTALTSTSEAPVSSAFVDATAADVYVRLSSTDVLGAGTLQTLGTWGQIFSLGGGTNGGGGLTEPIILTPNIVTQQTAPTVSIIDWSKNPNILTMTADTVFDFSNLPPSGKYEGVLVIIDIDEIGGFATPLWPESVNNPPVVSTVAGTRTSVMLYTIDGGIVVTHATSVGSSSGGGQNQTPWLSNIDAVGFSLNNLLSLDVEDSAGATKLNISGPLGVGARFSILAGDKAIFTSNITDILEIDDTTGLTILGSHVINMSQNDINLIKKANFDNSNVNTPSNENSIGFDFTDKELRYSVALTTDEHAWYADTDRLASLVRTGTDTGKFVINTIDTDVLTVASQFLIAPSSGVDPGLAGEFRLNGIDVKVFSGDAVRNLSNIGPQSSIEDGNVVLSVEQVTTSQPKLFLSNGANLQYTLEVNSSNNGFIDYRGFTATPLDQWNVFWDDSQVTISANKIIQFERFFSGNDAGVSGTQYAQYGFLTAEFANTLENGKIIFDVTSKGTSNFVGTDNSYSITGGAGLINTNTFHSFRGSMMLESDQDGDDAILRLRRNDTSMTIDDVTIGVIQFRGEDSAGNDTQYGSVSIEAADVSDTSENGRFAVDLINGALTERMIVADSLINEIKFSPTSSFSYLFDTTGLFLQKLSSNTVDADFTPIIFQSGGATPLSYAGIVPQVKESTDSGRLSIKVRADNNNSLTDALVINGGNNNLRSYLSIPARITSDLAFGLIDETGSAAHKISPLSAATTLQIAVQDNASFNTGSQGMIASPLVISGVSTTIAALDAAFGDHKGAEGFIEIASTLTKFVKQDNGNWGTVAYVFDAINT